MRYAILSDIHGNLEALESVMAALKTERIDAYLCAGDIVGYGADPAECLKRLRRLPIIAVAGNHDWAVAGRFDPAYFNREAREAVAWTRRHLDGDDLAYLNQLELVYQNEDLVMAHGTLYEPESFHYLSSMDYVRRSFALMEKMVCFIGHTHEPLTARQHGETIELSRAVQIALNQGDRYMINVGSVGQPRDGNPEAAYGVYDTRECRVEIRRVPYDIASAQQKILRSGLPALLAQRLTLGY